MAFLNVAGSTVPVAIEGVQIEYVEIGDRSRAWDGTMRTTIRSRKRVWRIPTVAMSTADAASLITALTGTAPLTAYGSLMPSTATLVHAELISETIIVAGTAARQVAAEFRLHEE